MKAPDTWPNPPPKGRVLYDDNESLAVVTHTAGWKSATRAYRYDEVWRFEGDRFTAVKNKCRGQLLALMNDNNINIRPDAASLNTGEPSIYRFVSDKDQFMFKLRFGA